LCTTNLPTPTIGATSTTQANDYFNTVLRNGFGTSGGTVTTGFYPDLVWQKQRNGISDHYLANTIAGGTKLLRTNSTAAEITDSNWITAFSSTGFTQGSSDWATGETVAVWAWNANSGSSSSNTAGSITSTVSANTTSGFSIVRWDGNGAGAAATIGHGLGVAPKMIINKGIDGTLAWSVYHASVGNTVRLTLNSTDAVDTSSGWWNNTTPTSTVFTVGSTINQATPYDYVAYCFAEVAGFSAFGSYTGNGSADGVFVYTGFRPAFVLAKANKTGYIWTISDSKRDPYNIVSKYLQPQASSAEGSSFPPYDFTSNGFKLRTTDGAWNESGTSYIYMAFAESPFKFANAR
jgi:hypothetical protein